MFPQPLSAFEQPTLSALEFDMLLEAAQPRLRGYVASILGAWSDVDDLVQESNLVLIQKRHNFEAGTNFIAWAFRIAYFKATTWRRDRMREGRVVLSEAAFQEIAAYAETHFEDRQPELDVLAQCLKRLSLAERELVNHRYVERRSFCQLAVAHGCRPNSIQKTMSRIRLTLRHCIHKHLRPQ